MALEERNNVCIGCGETEGDPHKPGCDRYTSSPIVRELDTPRGRPIPTRHEAAAAVTAAEIAARSPRGIPGPLVGGVPRLSASVEPPEGDGRWVSLITKEHVQELLARVRERHGHAYTVDDLVHDLHREGDNAIPIVLEPRRSATSVGWVEKIWLNIAGNIKGVIRTIDDTSWDAIRNGAGLAGNVVFDWTVKSDGSPRAAFLTEVVIQPPVKDVPDEDEPLVVIPPKAGWHVQSFQATPGPEAQATAIAEWLNSQPHSYKMHHIVSGCHSSVLVIGYRYDPESSF